MELLLTIQLLSAKRLQLKPLDYEGSLLLRWQILLPENGIDPLDLLAGIEAEQTIPTIGFLPRGQWSIPGGDRSIAPLAEISYSPLLDWFITTPEGFKNSQLLIYSYDQPTYQIPYTGTTVSFTPPPLQSEYSDKDSVATIAAVQGQPILVSPPNASRLNGFIVNNTNKTVWILFGSGSITNASPALPVSANSGNIDIEDGYEGAIQAFIAPGGSPATGSIVLHEFNSVN
jgi:hypothetical protein